MRNLVFIIIAIIVFSCQKSQPFNSEKWKKNGGENITTNNRLEMSKDLIDNKKLVGKHKSKIDSLLGKSADMILQTVEPNVLELYTVKEEYSNDIDPEKIIYLKVGYNWEKVCVSVELSKN
jgi:hypothetical protein